MPTPAEVSATLTAEATAMRTSADTARDAVYAHATDIDAAALDLLPPPEPDATLNVSNVLANATATTIVLHYTIPEGSPRTLISWGTGGTQTGQQFVLPPASGGLIGTYTISGLTPGTVYAVDMLAAQPDGTFNSDLAPEGGRVRVDSAGTTTTAATPEEPEPEAPAGDYPASPTAWDAKRDWTLAIAGAPATGLTVINSQASLTAAGLPGSWSGGVNGTWNLSSGGPFHHLDVQGLIYYTGQAALTLRDSVVRGIRYASSSGKSGGLFERVEVEINTATAVGQGAINFWGQNNWTIRRCIISGFADGSQCSGNGLVEESVIRDLRYSPTSHNDWIQHYGGGVVRCVRTVFDSSPPQANAHNGVFSSNDVTADYELVDCDARVAGAFEDSSNIMHANTGTIQLVRSRVRGGRLIADVRYGADSFVSGNPAA